MSGSNGPRDDDVDPPDGSREVIRAEARHVIDEQLQTLRETDQKALATARIIGLILGLLVSAASIADEPSTVVNDWILYGGGVLLVSLGISVFTYSVDRPSFGIGPGFIDTTLTDIDSDDGVGDDLLARYADWISDNGEEISTNGTYLLVSQVLFLVGLGLLAWGVHSII